MPNYKGIPCKHIPQITCQEDECVGCNIEEEAFKAHLFVELYSYEGVMSDQEIEALRAKWREENK